MLSLFKQRWPSFEPEEVLSPEGLVLFSQGHLMIHPFALDYLQSFRNFLGAPALVNHSSLRLRGWRSWHENSQISGSARYSMHCFGCAFDVTVRGYESHKLAAIAETFGWHGVGCYGSFVHLDLRPRLDNKVVKWGRDWS